MIKKGNKNVEAVIIILIFIVSMLPIWYLAGYAVQAVMIMAIVY